MPASKLREEDVPDSEDGFVPEEPPKSQASPLQTFALRGLSALSVAGLPNVLGAVDTLTGTESARSVDRPDLRPGDPNFKAKSALEKFYANRAFYERGLEAAGEENPKAALAGDIAPVLVPGPGGKGKAAASLGNLAKRGAVVGGAQQLFRGDAKTLEGDIEGTLEDVGEGAGFGAAANVGGALLGKGIEKVGTAVGNKLRGDVLERAKSLIGRFRQQKQEASSATEKARLMEMAERALQLIGRAEQQGAKLTRADRPLSPAGRVLRNAPDNLARDLQEGAAGNLERVQSRFAANQERFGRRGVPGLKQAKGLAESELQVEASAALPAAFKAGLRGAVGGFIGGETAEAIGANKGAGQAVGAGLFAGGGSPKQNLAAIGRSLFSNPRVMRAIGSNFPELGRALAKLGGNASEALVRRLMAEPDVAEVVEQAQSDEEDGFIPD